MKKNYLIFSYTFFPVILPKNTRLSTCVFLTGLWFYDFACGYPKSPAFLGSVCQNLLSNAPNSGAVARLIVPF